MEETLAVVGLGPSGKATLVQCGLVAASAGALVQALTVATSCASSEWGVSEGRAWAVSQLVVLGEVLGAAVWGFAADALGRAEVSSLACVLAAGSAVICALATSFDALSVGCFGCGFALGGMAAAPSVLMVERSAAQGRGRYAAALGFFFAAGGAFAAVAHAAVHGAVENLVFFGFYKLDAHVWRGAFLFVALLPLGAAVACSRRLPESVRWLLSKRRDAAARRVVEAAASANFGSHHAVTHAMLAFDAALDALDEALVGGAGPAGRAETTCVASETRRVASETSRAALAALAAAALPQMRNSARLRRILREVSSAAMSCLASVAFLHGFASFAVLQLIRLEFDADGRADASAFATLRQSLQQSLPHGRLLRPLGSARWAPSLAAGESCAALDYTLVSLAVISQVAGTWVSRHLIDIIGRRLTLSSLFAVAAAGVLCLATPEYVSQVEALTRTSLLCALMATRGALAAAQTVVAIFAAELHAVDARASAVSLIYVSARLGGLAATSWVAAPTPVSTASLLAPTRVRVWKPKRKSLKVPDHRHGKSGIVRCGELASPTDRGVR